MTFNPAEPRDTKGRWTDGIGGALSQISYQETIDELAQLGNAALGDRVLSAAELSALTKYAGNNYETINSGLRKANRISQQVLDLDSAILKSVLTHPVTVFRGAGSTLTKKIEQQWKASKASSFIDKAFVSTSASKKSATKFSKNLIEIKLPAGTPAIALANEGEAELLLGRGHTFKVTSVTVTSIGHRRIKAELVL